MTQRKRVNPFYVLLVLAGIAFFLTASAYGVLTVKGLYPEGTPKVTSAGAIVSTDSQGPPAPSRLLDWLDKNGFQLLMCELAVLAVFTFAAIGTDSYWSRDGRRTDEAKNSDRNPDHES